MTYILNVYKKDTRTKSGKRIVGSYELQRKNKEIVYKEIRKLETRFKKEDGYIFKVLEVYENSKKNK
jgi:hypothetical protein